MKFTEEKPQDKTWITAYDAQSFTYGGKTYHTSALLTHQWIEAHYPHQNLEELTQTDINYLLDKKPEIVLIGTGTNQAWLKPNLVAQFYAAGVGLEVMNNASAIRTFNVMATEDREVLLLLLYSKL